MGGLGGGGMGHLHTQEYHHPGRSALRKFTNNNPFFTYCKVVSNCFLLFITRKTNSEPFRHRRLLQSCFSSVLILLDMALSFGSAPNSSLACNSFTLEQYMHTYTHPPTRSHPPPPPHTHTHKGQTKDATKEARAASSIKPALARTATNLKSISSIRKKSRLRRGKSQSAHTDFPEHRRTSIPPKLQALVYDILPSTTAKHWSRKTVSWRTVFG